MTAGMAIGLVFWMAGVGALVFRLARMFGDRYEEYVDRYVLSAEKTLGATDVFMAPEELLRMSYMAAMACGGLGIFIGLQSAPFFMLMLAGVFGFLGFHAPRWVLTILARRRLNRFEAQLPDAIDLLSKSLRAGLSPAAAFGVGAHELPHPASQEFAIVVRDTQNNRPLAEAVRRLADRMSLEDTRLLAVVMDLGMREGGNMTEALDAVAQTVRHRFNIRRKVKVATASARAQLAVVASMPFVMLGIFSVTNPEMMAPLWTTGIGWALIGAVVVLETIGILVMLKIARSVEY